MLFHSEDGAVVWPPHEIAVLRREWEDRLEATSATGERAWCQGPLEPHARQPLHEAAPGVLVNPRHARRDGDLLRLPGGHALPAVPLPAPEPPPEEDPDEVLAWRPPGRWVTPAGERPAPGREEAASLHPDLVPAGRYLVHPGGVRALARRGARGFVVLRDGTRLHATWPGLRHLAEALGLDHPDPYAALPERVRLVYERGFQDWPEEFLRMEPGPLRAALGSDVRLLVDRVLWQLYRLRAQGRGAGYGRDVRGVFYSPLVIVAHRAGVLAQAEAALADTTWIPPDLRDLWDVSLPEQGVLGRQDDLYTCLQERLEWLIGEKRLFTYRSLEFDLPTDQVRIGDRRPHVVLVVEKGSLQADARVVADLFGVSMVVLGGAPRLLVTEALVSRLAGRVDRPLLLVSLCDFDPYGWYFPDAVARQLDRYGFSTGDVRRLVKPERFTPEEIALLAMPLSTTGTAAAQVERWLRDSGGLAGRALGLYADHLRPVERLVEAFRQETGLAPR